MEENIKFTIGEWATWIMSRTGDGQVIEKTAECVAIVPAGVPVRKIFRTLPWEQYGTCPISFSSSPRDHKTYLFAAPSINSKRNKTHVYWPKVSTLRRSEAANRNTELATWLASAIAKLPDVAQRVFAERTLASTGVDLQQSLEERLGAYIFKISRMNRELNPDVSTLSLLKDGFEGFCEQVASLECPTTSENGSPPPVERRGRKRTLSDTEVVERRRARKRRYYQTHKEHLRQYGREYYHRHKAEAGSSPIAAELVAIEYSAAEVIAQ